MHMCMYWTYSTYAGDKERSRLAPIAEQGKQAPLPAG